jgi:RNA recognition motif-containing protein
MKLFISGLPFRTTEQQIVELLAPFGSAESIDMARDSKTKRFRGFCFVEMPDEAAQAAIASLNGSEYARSTLKVEAARVDPAEEASADDGTVPFEDGREPARPAWQPPPGGPNKGATIDNRMGKSGGHGDRG